MLTVSQSFADAITNRGLTNEAIRTALKECITVSVPKEQGEMMYQALLAMPDGELWQAQDDKVYPCGASGVAVIGCGDHSLVRYLIEMLLLPNLDFEKITTCQARILGSYVIQKAKQYVHKCGGPTDICALSREGFLVSRDNGIMEDDFNELEHWLGLWLRTMTRKESDVEDRNRETGLLVGYLGHMREKLEARASAWQLPTNATL